MKLLFAVLVSAVLLGDTFLVPSSCSDAAAEGISTCDPSACASKTKLAAAAAKHVRAQRGSVRGAYDPTMAGCQFSCAAKIAHRERDLHAQPGARDGQLVRCPVSGVVFKADAQRPRVRLATGKYVTCCNSCANKLSKNPSRLSFCRQDGAR